MTREISQLKFAPTSEEDKLSLLKNLFEQAVSDQKVELLIKMLLTLDERDLLIARMNIFFELLEQSISQREIAKKLGTGIATVTRGSTTLKKYESSEHEWLKAFLDRL